jgi:hypothetical protein
VRCYSAVRWHHIHLELLQRGRQGALGTSQVLYCWPPASPLPPIAAYSRQLTGSRPSEAMPTCTSVMQCARRGSTSLPASTSAAGEQDPSSFHTDVQSADLEDSGRGVASGGAISVLQAAATRKVAAVTAAASIPPPCTYQWVAKPLTEATTAGENVPEAAVTGPRGAPTHGTVTATVTSSRTATKHDASSSGLALASPLGTSPVGSQFPSPIPAATESAASSSVSHPRQLLQTGGPASNSSP